MSFTPKFNHLEKESSLYLQQHAKNPVDWYSWSEKAFDKARRENKPILLSIGYSSCHWCHVMAHESFEDEETAQLMNELFINIKVDKEERPDLDKVYQTAHYLLNQTGGGWPLTVFLTPQDHTPFFSGTYFPRVSRYHLPSFKDVLRKISEIYHSQPDAIKQQNNSLREVLNQTSITTKMQMNDEPFMLAKETLQHRYDRAHGGFDEAPKFPQASILNFLFKHQPELISHTLTQMAMGGIYDQLEGGFFRYTVDEKWQIPHFEKMLYDNGQLLFLYAYALSQWKNSCFADVVNETAKWIINKMQSPEGGYYSSLDADSEGHEGKYYVWNREEIKKILNDEEFAVIEAYFGLDQTPNFESNWHFFIATNIETIANNLKISVEQAKQQLSSAKEKILTIRAKRIPPSCDAKVLTAWNSLMIKGMLLAGENLHEPLYFDSAHRSIRFIQKNLWKNKRLLASYCNNKAYLSAYLDDYVFLMDALMTALQLEWNEDYLLFAIDLAEAILANFYDDQAGGFYFTAHDHESLIFRPKPMMDEAMPAGNGIAVRVLLQLGYLLGETRYLDAAEKTLLAAWPMLMEYPASHCSLLLALNDYLHPEHLLILRGSKQAMQDWLKNFDKTQKLIFSIPNDEMNLPGALALRKPIDEVCAYVCQGTHCLNVIRDKEEFQKIFKS